MSFLINIQESDLQDIIKYEKILIYAVSEMNKIYAQKYDFYDTCLNCLGIEYVDGQSQEQYLEIDHISDILDKKWAKCDSLVAWFMAVKELQGFVTEPIIINNGSYMGFHVKMKYKPQNSGNDYWKQIDPSQIIKSSCQACQLTG